MKTKDEVLAMLMSRLTELRDGSPGADLANRLTTESELLYNILGEDVPEEYWDEIIY